MKNKSSTKLIETDKSVSLLPNDQLKVDEAVKFINEKANETIYKGSIEIGEYLLNNFFNNDIGLSSSKNPKKNISFNKLCERYEIDMHVHPNTLAIALRVAVQERYFIENKINTENLTYTHKASLVKLENNQTKIKLIQACIEHKWSTRQLEKEIKKKLTVSKKNNKDSIFQLARRYVTNIEKFIGSIDESKLNIDLSKLNEMENEKRQKIYDKFKNLKKITDKSLNKLQDISKNCDIFFEQFESIKIEDKKESSKKIPSISE